MHLSNNIREITRHAVTRGGLNAVYVALRAAMRKNVSHLKEGSLNDRFSLIYQNRVWTGRSPQGSPSGPGSDLENTNSIRLHLPAILAQLQTKTLLDVGCGDFNRVRTVPLGCEYIEIDCVQSVIEKNKAHYRGQSRHFYALDATRDPLPQADTVLCREILFHLSFHDIWALLQNVRRSGASSLIATNDAGSEFNADIWSGDYRILNLTKAPFRFGPPSISIPDDEVTPDRILAVWSFAELPLGVERSKHVRIPQLDALF